MKSLEISSEAIQQRLLEVSEEVQRDYSGKKLLIIGILKGAICLVADLMRLLSIPFEVDFIRCSSYGQRGTQNGPLTIADLERLNLTGYDVLLVDDILDSGQTLSQVISQMEIKSPKSLKTLVLLNKKRTRSIHFDADYVLFDIDDLFVVGYGLDYKEQLRGLNGIYALS